MNISTIILFIFFAAIATSYGWGMRGTIIGGEKGAMLPGAMLGFAIAAFSGSEVLMSHSYLLASIGAISMYCGGNMTYFETLEMTMKKPAPNFKKGIIAVFVKGSIWFGLFGGYVSMYISAISYQYSALALILFFVFLPVSAFIGFFVFNKPFKPEQNKFPKIYFSATRRETWGGLLGLLVEILVFSIVIKDFSTLAMTAGTLLVGGFGWLIAQLLQIRAIHPGKNGKKLFNSANEKNLIDAWKIMECTFGAIGGGGTAALFILCRPLFAEKLALLDTNGLNSFVSDKQANILLIIYGIILLADVVQYIIRKDEKTAGVSYSRYKKLCEHTEFAVYSIIPMTMCFFGAHNVTITLYFALVLLVLCQEFAEKCLKKDSLSPLINIAFFIPIIALFVVQLITNKPFPIHIVFLMYTFVYEIAYPAIRKIEFGKFRLHSTEKTVHAYFIICCVIINILAFVI